MFCVKAVTYPESYSGKYFPLDKCGGKKVHKKIVVFKNYYYKEIIIILKVYKIYIIFRIFMKKIIHLKHKILSIVYMIDILI